MKVSMIQSKIVKIVSVVGLLAVVADLAQASYVVQVGYADNLRPTPFFPSPWSGGANVDFFDGAGPSFDAGAIRVINTGATSISFDGLTVDSFGNGASYNIWNGSIGNSILAGHSAIFTQNAGFNFDTSDNEGSNPLAIPRVTIKIDTISKNFFDTAQVLNTEGDDHLAQQGLNESHQWREIGTFGGQSGNVPDGGSTLGLLGLALTGIAILRGRTSKA